jgi:hypothetical protein
MQRRPAMAHPSNRPNTAKQARSAIQIVIAYGPDGELIFLEPDSATD